MSAGSHVQTAQNFKTSEAWPSSGWLPPGALAGPQPRGSIQVLDRKLFKPYPVHNPDGSKGPAQNSQMHNPVINPKTFRIQFQTENNNEHDREHNHIHPSHFHPGIDLGSHPHAHSHTGSSNYPQKDQKPGFQLSFSVPFPTTTTTTTAAPTAPPNVNAGFSYLGPSRNEFFHDPFKIPGTNKMSDPTHVVQKPLQSKLVTFLTGLLQKGQSNENSQINSQHNKVFFKSPHSQSGSFSNPQSSSNIWAAHMQVAGSNDAGSDVQTPVHQAGQTPMYNPPQWYHVHKPPRSNEELRQGILQSVQYVNGQLMIPLEKCPGFEKFAAILKGHYHGFVHGHVQHHYKPPLHGHAHQYENTYYGHLHQQRLPPDIYHHGQLSHERTPQHGYVYQHGHDQQHGHPHYHGPQTKPSQASYFLNVQGTVPSPTEPTQQTNVQDPHIHQHGQDHQNGYYHYRGLQTKPNQASYFLNVQGTVPSPTEPQQQTYVQVPNERLPPLVHQHGHNHQNGDPHSHYHGLQTKPNQASFFLNVQGTVLSPTESPQETTVQSWGPNVQQHGQHSHGHVYQHWQPPQVHRHDNAHYHEPQSKPKHPYNFFNEQGTAQSTTEPPQEVNVKLWGEYHENPFSRWQRAPRGSKPMHKEPEKQQ